MVYDTVLIVYKQVQVLEINMSFGGALVGDPGSDLGTHWRDYIVSPGLLAWECLGIHQEELEVNAREKVCYSA